MCVGWVFLYYRGVGIWIFGIIGGGGLLLGFGILGGVLYWVGNF